MSPQLLTQSTLVTRVVRQGDDSLSPKTGPNKNENIASDTPQSSPQVADLGQMQPHDVFMTHMPKCGKE